MIGMKKKTIFSLVALVTVFALNVQWLGLAQEGYLFNVANALYQKNVQLDGGGGGFEGGYEGGGYDFLYDPGIVEILVVEDVETTPTVPNPTGGGVTKLTCPWECGEQYWFPSGFYAIPEMCTEGNILIQDINADINAGRTGDWDGAGSWGANSVYDAGEKVAWDGLWVWDRHSITTGIGWTAWWVGLANYCEANGWWTSSNAQSIAYGDTATLTFTIAENIEGTGGTYGVDLLAKDTTAGVLRMQGNYAASIIAGGQTVMSPSFNSPFIYFEVPDGAYNVSLDSHWDMYQSVTPAFTAGSGWDVDVKDGQAVVNGDAYEHLFYELAMHRIDLTRNGINFSSKEELVAFLEDSNFFENLHMSEVEKQNSLAYLVPKLEASPNYYLTILDSAAIESLSQITVAPTPEQLVRTYYAVYPTITPVKTTGGLEYPSDYNHESPVVKEYGEIIVKPEMYVFWK
jgi:hypothetical protein